MLGYSTQIEPSLFHPVPDKLSQTPSARESADVPKWIQAVQHTAGPVPFRHNPRYLSHPMLLSGGEDIDLIVTPVVTDAMNSGAFLDMSELLDEYGQGIKDVLGDNIDACKYRGALYGVPSMHEFAKTPLIIYNKDMADQLNLDMSTVRTLEDLDPILAKVVEAYPNMSTPLYTGSSSGALSSTFGNWDTLGDNLGVIMYDGDQNTVVNLFETQEYKDLCTTLQVLLLEWTHAGNPTLQGIDLNLFLYSSPEDTLERRKRRARNANTDTPLIALVLELEQIMLNENAKHADIIQLMDGKILSQADYLDKFGGKQ